MNFVKENSIEKYLKEEIFPGIYMMAKENLKPLSFAYPYGAHTPQLDSILLKYFSHIRATAYTSKKYDIFDLNQIYCKCRNERLIFGVGIDNIYGNSIEEIYKGLKRALEKKEIIVLYIHNTLYIEDDHGTSFRKLESILKYASEIGLKFYRVSDLGEP